MAAITIFHDPGREGESKEYGTGIYRVPFGVASFWMSNGYRGRFHDSQDGSVGGGIGHSQWFYPRTNDLYNARRPLPGRQPHMVTIEVEQTDLTDDDLVVLLAPDPKGGDAIPFALGPGKHEYQSGPDAGEFPNDVVNAIIMPDSCEALVYADGGEQGRHQVFSAAGQHPVSWGASSVEVKKDGWERVGPPEIDYDDGEHKLVGEFVQDVEAYNDTDLRSDVELGGDMTVTDSANWHWTKNASLAATESASVTAEGDVAPLGVGGKVSATVGVSFTETVGIEGGKGGDHSESHTAHASMVVKDVPPHTKIKGQQRCQHWAGTFPMKQVLRNKRTGATTTAEGVLREDFAGKTYIKAGEQEAIPH